MIVSVCADLKSEIDINVITNMIESSIEDKKCIEIYMKQGDMIYIKKNEEKDYTYGYYFCSTDDFEWKCNSVTVYPSNMTIEFVYNNLFKETREFDISDCTKLYIGDEWSN